MPSYRASTAKDHFSRSTDVGKNCSNNGNWAGDCTGGGAEKGTTGDDGKRRSEGKGAAKNFDGNCRNCGKYDDRAASCWTTCPTKPTEKGHGRNGKCGTQVHEQEKAGEDAFKDIGGLSNAF